jgi:hypothetical protein
MAIVIAAELAKRILIWGVLAIVVVPRHHIDREAMSIGGNLSHSFRKLLVASVGLNLLRLAAKLHGHVRLFADILGCLQSVSLSFLCFVTPYILQTWLVTRINIGGRPGANLLPALYGTAIFSILGVILCRVIHPNLWCLKRLGNVCSGLPVLKTLGMYNSVTSVGGHHHGRGTIMSQTMVAVEYWYIVAQLLCVIGLAFDKHEKVENYSQWDYCLEAFRDIAFVSDWTRVCFHGVFMNLLDEMYSISASSSTCSANNGHSTNNYDEEEKGLVLSRSPLSHRGGGIDTTKSYEEDNGRAASRSPLAHRGSNMDALD